MRKKHLEMERARSYSAAATLAERESMVRSWKALFLSKKPKTSHCLDDTVVQGVLLQRDRSSIQRNCEESEKTQPGDIHWH
jgi:hypothetical protein